MGAAPETQTRARSRPMASLTFWNTRRSATRYSQARRPRGSTPCTVPVWTRRPTSWDQLAMPALTPLASLSLAAMPA